jgi:hypothetical protein
MRPADSETAWMRPADQFEFETPDLTEQLKTKPHLPKFYNVKKPFELRLKNQLLDYFCLK